MRKEKRNQKKNNKNTSVFITGGVLIAALAVFVITFIVYANKFDNDLYALDSEYLAQYTNSEQDFIQEENKIIDTTSASSSIGKTVEESEKELTNETITKDTSNRKTEATLVNTNTKSEENTVIEEKDPVFIKPIDGEVLKEYAKDSLIYSETLKEWTTHFGVDIKAERATVVKAAADGVVKHIKNDPRYGLTIIIEHSNGFETRYANLLTTEFVSEGENLKAGQTIGTVGDSAIYEIVDESHLHFEILKNSESVNPAEYISF